MQEERLGKKSLSAVQPPWGALCWPGRGGWGCGPAALPKDTTACRGSVGDGEEGVLSVPCVWSHHAPSTAISHSPCVMVATSLRTRSMPLFPWSSFTTVAFYDVSVLTVVLGTK